MLPPYLGPEFIEALLLRSAEAPIDQTDKTPKTAPPKTVILREPVPARKFGPCRRPFVFFSQLIRAWLL
jgi:hypothetical protein